MYCSRYAAGGILIAALAFSSCVRPPDSGTAGRIAVLRFENLGPDGSPGWVGRALSEVVAAQLAAVPGLRTIAAPQLHSYDLVLGSRPIAAPGISAETTQARLAGATRLVYGEYTVRQGKLEVRVTIEDSRTLHMSGVFAVSAAADDVLGAATRIAHQIDSKAGPYTTRSALALSGYIHGLEAANAGLMEQSLSAAIQADADFAAPYRLLAQEHRRRGDLPGANAVLDQALARGDRIPPLERARIEYEAAEISGDLGARESALANMARLDPSDASSWRALGESFLNRHEYRRARESLQKSTGLEPNDPAAWNSLGYAAAYAGDLAAGTAALRRYQSLAPTQANPLDSLGDIHFVSGKLDQAEKFYLEAFQKDPNFLNQGDLLKAAVARLFSGDLSAAGEAANRYFDARAKARDPILDYRRAQWLWLTGRRKQAYRQLQEFAAATENTPLRDTSSRAGAELALWSLMLGDRPAAQALAAKALHLASPPARGNAIVAAFLAQPPASASEWSVRAEQAFNGPGQTGIRNFALSYALLVNGDFKAAQLLLKQTWESGAPTADEGLPVMLAWTLLETGKPRDAAPLLQFNPVANANGLTPYASFYLPRIFYLRGVLAEKEGRTTDAAAEFQRFLTLSGDTPLVWGEEAKARR